MKKMQHQISGEELTVGNIVHVENKLGYYRIVTINGKEYELSEITNPYSLLFWTTLAFFKNNLYKVIHKSFRILNRAL